MNYINIVLVITIIYIAYRIVNINSVTKENMVSVSNIDDKTNIENKVDIDKIIKDLNKWDLIKKHNTKIEKNPVKPNFSSKQFHNDYRDIISGLNAMVLSHKQVFNIPHLPVDYSEPYTEEVNNLVSDFIQNLNTQITNKVKDFRSANTGWDEHIPDPEVEDGWNVSQRNLGIIDKLYDKPLGKTQIKLISIEKVQKYTTEDEVKYTIYLILEKIGAKDQMVLKISFVIDKKPLGDENKFFSDELQQLNVVIESYHVEGYLSDAGDDDRKLYANVKNNMYIVDKSEYDNITSQKDIQTQLMDHYNKKTKESEYRTALLDEEGRDFHRTLPKDYQYQSYKVTQTIFDDMNNDKKFS